MAKDIRCATLDAGGETKVSPCDTASRAPVAGRSRQARPPFSKATPRIEIPTPAADRINDIGIRPVKEDFLDKPASSMKVGFADELRDKGLERSRAIPGHGLMKVEYGSCSRRIRKRLNIGRHFNPLQWYGLKHIALEPDIRSCAYCSISPRETAHLPVLVSGRIDKIRIGITSGDGCYACVRQGQELIRCRVAVTVQIAPNLQVRPNGILVVNQSICIGVEFVQCLEPVRRLFSICQQGFTAKKLPARINPPISVAVENKQTVIGADPAGRLGEAVRVVVEIGAGANGHGFDAVAIEIENDWRSLSRRSCFCCSELVGPAFEIHQTSWKAF
ncbi:hypothetical protein RHDC3_00707 [Rhodocyclaceae bacterium]|nr:hypothetical protein RHDC3_00707 [Rhodocyclaceae bacterium]